MKTEPASIALSNVLPALALLTLVSRVQKVNSCLKENAMLDALFHWSTEDVPTSVHLDFSLKLQAETASNVTTDAELVKALQTDVPHVNQELLIMVLALLPAQLTLSVLTETVPHVLKDAVAAQTQSVNAQAASQDSSWLAPDVLPHAMLDSSETEIMDAENAQKLANHALLPLLAHPVLKPETNQSTESAIIVFSHALTVPHTNNVPLVYRVSALSMEDVPANAQPDRLQSMELADAQTEFSTTDNAQLAAHQDGLTSMELANNVTVPAVNVQEKSTLAQPVSQVSF